MKKKGLTLVELIAVMAILSIVLTTVYFIFNSYNNIYTNEYTDNTIRTSGKVITEEISQNIKKATYASVNFNITSGNNINITDANGSNKIIKVNKLVKPLIYLEQDNSSCYLYAIVENGENKELHKFTYVNNNSNIDNNISINVTDIVVSVQNKSAFEITAEVYYRNRTNTYVTTASLRKRS